MQQVSNEYKESMKSIGRNRGYINITIGVVNSEAQDTLKVADDNDFTYYSSDAILGGETVEQEYVTCEGDWSRVDGTMYFLPNDSASSFYNNGLVSNSFEGTITFDFDSTKVFDLAGLTIDFSENYAVDFTISNGTETFEVTDNTERYYRLDHPFDGTNKLIITASKMRNPNTRLRIYSITMGISNTFNNDNTVGYTETTYVSAIAESIPSTDTEIRVTNYDQYYNPDNPSSVLSYFEQGQEVKVKFGYDSKDDGNIEWLPEKITHLKTWSATDTEARFTTVDQFDYLSGIYYGGKYYEDGITLYDLALDVLSKAGITKYKLDNYLKKITVHNPLPAVEYTQALQIIANAGKCVLREDRDGMIYLDAEFVPNSTLTADEEYQVSNVQNIKSDIPKIAYALCAEDFCSLGDENLYFMSESPNTESVGFVSNAVTVNGYFINRPTLTFNFESSFTPNDVIIYFRTKVRLNGSIKGYLDNKIVFNYGLNMGLPLSNRVKLSDKGITLREVDKIVIDFTSNIYTQNYRMEIDRISFGDVTDYMIERDMLMDSPTAIREEKIKNIKMSTYNYRKSDADIKTLSTLNYSANNVSELDYTFHLTNPSYGYELVKQSGVFDFEIVSSSAYEVSVKIKNKYSRDIRLALNGYEYLVDEQFVSVEHNTTGTEKTWGNPLISDTDHALLVEDWLADYFLGSVEYEFDWRGDPRTDANDLFFFELKSGEIVNVRGYQTTLNFNGAWSGSMKARKVLE